jgi:urea transporter/murein DD-endopeptidase MepM/ murein hydrolase activator NlpD
MPQLLKILREDLIPATLNSYSVIFFFNSRLFGIVLLIASFFNFSAGLSGLIAVIFSVLVTKYMGFDELRIKQGIYSFNALLTGIGMGTFFEQGGVYFVLLLLAVLFSLMISVILGGWLGKYGLPFLSIPFVLSFWLILLPSGQLVNLGLTQKNIFWMNEIYAVGGKTLLNLFQTIENLPLSRIVTFYFRSLSSIIFQDNLITGILIAVAILITSRITFLLSLAGFLTAYLFAHLVGSDMAGFSFYNAGANYILVAIAAGGFFVIPSRYSFMWMIFLVPMTSLLILFMAKLVPVFGAPFFSLPFSIMIISFVYFLLLRVKPGKMVLTPFQYYSPEVNLYTHNGNIDRKTGYMFFALHLPFWGEWKVSQGYDGKHTHKGDWGNAVDFVLTDEKDKTHGASSSSCEDYFCYNKPVLAPADGTVTELIDYIDDNEPGKVNLVQNWGNTIIIHHAANLYTQLSHIKAGSFRVKKGDYVRKGDMVGLCGNSGRSPEPHLHYQVQTTPLPGSRTLSYPFSYFLTGSDKGVQLKSYSIPLEGEKVSNVLTTSLLKEAFELQPGTIMKFRYTNNGDPEKEIGWEVFTDAWNTRYLYCSETRSTAYFVNDGTMFYFISFYGDRKSLLYYFYLSAYKVLLGYYETIRVEDVFPLHNVAGNSPALWLHDLTAPFHQYLKANYSIVPSWADSQVNPGQVRLSSEIILSSFSSQKREGSARILIAENQVKHFSFESAKTKVWAQRVNI